MNKIKPKVAIVRGKFLNSYEMQTFEYLLKDFDLTAFGSFSSFHHDFSFPSIRLLSFMDIPDFSYKMSILNRLTVDAHYLLSLESHLKGFDIAHSAETYYHYTQQCINAKNKKMVKKVVLTILENIPFNNEDIFGRKEFKKRAREEADILIALTEKTKSALIKEGAREEKVRVIGSGIDINRFKPHQIKSKKEITILFVGRLEIYKGVIDLIEAFSLLLKDQDLSSFTLKLLIVGEGSQKKDMIKKEKENGHQVFIDHTKSPYNLIHEQYQKADIFVAPSHDTKTWQEQYGYMLLEAQASGLPIITTNSGSIPEVVGNAALVVQQKNVLELKESLKKLILDEKLRYYLGNKARERAEKIHDSKKIANRIADVYKSIL